mmetsp:Transcript_48/g.111  ORF Transcript_48/g.111 Transcript_48/m.111 type:complete len:219 (-) Transcript_48:342-998(-)|eukprot:CAMPEP_0114507334 /NCGR_PEP_ID=MMETSP0109-20121206/11953_1 /TAXON_ID=29199 /ORGANISM="Chlorarachnion reptans, Strain CCCM449" /LENGTH=218 /DNA_ID=CAMNT_0001686077 /DNA_START=239 /DNA_END=895 /DNA_ORIENTATION=+
MSAARIERDLKTYAARNDRLERHNARIGTAKENEELWDKIEEEMQSNKDLSRVLLDRIKALHGQKKSGLSVSFKKEYKRFQDIVNKINRTGNQDSVGNALDNEIDHPSQQQLRLNEVKRQEELERKAEKVKALNKDVADLADMFKDVAALVDNQQETVDQIAVSVAKAKEHTESAAQDLHAADNYLQAARKRWLCISIILIIIAAVLGVIVWVATRNK